MGVPSVFLRTFGCNFRCKNFSRYKEHILGDETHNPEVIQIIRNLDNYRTYSDLPLVKTGCDSYASVYPEFKKYAQDASIDAIVEGIVSMLPHKEWRDEHLVITGGEPLLGWQRAYPELLEHESMVDLEQLTFETNGTQELSDELADFLFAWSGSYRTWDDITFSVSPKLSVSGEKWEDAIKPDIIQQYSEIGYTYLKFVVENEKDLEEVDHAVDEYRSAGFRGTVYLMPVGGVESVYSLNNRKVAEMAMAKGYRYSDRLQVPLFKNAWGT